MYDLAESSFIFSCRESHPRQSQEATPSLPFSPSSRHLGDEISAPVFPMLPFSRSNLPTCSSYIYLPYLHVPDVETTTTANRPVEHNSVGTRFFFFFFFAIILRSPRARSIDVYDAKAQSASFFCLLESLHDYGLLKLFDREGTEFSRPTTETFS